MSKGHLLVVCAKRYNGHELWTLLGILDKREFTFEVVSQDTLIRDELTLRPHLIDRVVWDVPLDEVSNFDGICVVSGNMVDTEAYWKDKYVMNLLQAFRDADKAIAAICCSVPTLAPVCRDVKVSYFPLIRSRDRLRQFGASLQPTSLTVDGKTVTAENQMITEMWAEEICNVLEGQPQAFEMHDSGFIPKGFERKMMPEVRASIDEARGFKMVMRKKPKV